jgi:RecA/RadA recombinase
MIPSTASIRPDHGRARRLRDGLPAGLQHAVVRAADLARERHGRLRDAPMPTSVAAFDRLLGGGLPRGCLVELVGRGSCGRFAALLAALTAVTDTGQAAVLVDQGDQLDPQAAAAAGLDLERLLWLRPRSLPETLAAAELLVSTGFPLVAVDLGLPPVRGRSTLAAWPAARSRTGRWCWWGHPTT